MKKLQGWLEKIKQLRRDQWVVILLAGILILLISLPGADRENEEVTAETEAKELPLETAEEIERRLEAILGQLEGAGKVRVMITQRDNGQKVVEKDVPSVSRTTQEEQQEGARSTTEQEVQEATVYTRNGSGYETPYVSRELAPQVEGVLVLAEGADNALVKKDITDAVMALFGLEAHKIKVMKMKERSG